ncbi:MAG: mechanosensitive ion channel protein MscS [Cyanobacteria bacterium SW_8_48_13]|nr:MAG: mechanosensitive ion channel protein MscS [Cyanobacteria bacterium SW_8_48_13]
MGIKNLILHPIISQAIDVLSIVIVTLVGINFLSAIVEYILRIYWIRGEEDITGEQSINVILPAIRLVFWIIGTVFLLGNLGFDISALVASLGIGGVAIALASQGVLQDLFSYFSILLDRPVQIDDFIIVGDFVGTVEHIGIKTTRMRNLSGEQLIIANTELTGSRIRNFNPMEERRIVFTIGVTYDTGFKHLQEIPNFIQSIIEATKNTRFDRCHFSSYRDSSLNFETVYYMTTSDYTAYMDAQQHINLEIKQAFEQRGIEFAFPTQVVHVNNGADGVAKSANPIQAQP